MSSFRTTVRLGEHNISTDEDCENWDGEFCAEPVQDIPVESVTIHENYSRRNFSNDIALIRLARPADLTKSNVKTICLPTTNDNANISQGIWLTVAGWGQSENSRGKSDELLTDTVSFVSLKKCDEIFKNASKNVQLHDSIICAGDESNACIGDSGKFKPFDL